MSQKKEAPLEWAELLNKKRIWSDVMMVVAIVMIVGGATASGYFLKRRAAFERQMSNVAGATIVSAPEAVRNIMAVPNEEPLSTLVTDQDLLSGLPIYAKAQVGDVVLYYRDAGKSVLYDPETNRVVEVINDTGSSN